MGEVSDLRDKVAELREALAAAERQNVSRGIELLAANRENEQLRGAIGELKQDKGRLIDTVIDESKQSIQKVTMWEKIDFLESNLKGAQEHNRALPKEQQSNEMWTRAEWKPIEHLVSPEEAAKFKLVGENGAVVSYQHSESGRYLHVNSNTGQCYDRNKNEIDKDVALAHALPKHEIRQEAGIVVGM
jgi:hypothetical protein